MQTTIIWEIAPNTTRGRHTRYQAPGRRQTTTTRSKPQNPKRDVPYPKIQNRQSDRLRAVLTASESAVSFPRLATEAFVECLFLRVTDHSERAAMATQRNALAAVLVLGLWQGGCATVAPTVVKESSLSSTYGGGRATQDFTAPIDRAATAVFEAMDDLKITSISRGRDGSVYKFDGKTEDNRSVLVTLRPNDGQTRVGCRVGWFGDELLSKAVLERTGVRLGTLPPAAIPDKPPSSPERNPLLKLIAPPDDAMIRDIAEAPYRDRVVPP
jgi:hypothetical protein